MIAVVDEVYSESSTYNLTGELGSANVDVDFVSKIEPLKEDEKSVNTLTVPTELREALLGQPAPSDDELALGRFPPEFVPHLKCYILVDAAKITNAVQLIEASDLPYRCLFTGDAFDELADVAPWLIELQDGNAFARQLFLSGDAQWCLWGKAPLIFFRSRGTLKDVWQHLRKFTNIKMQNGISVYLRFWDAIAFRALVLSGGDASTAFMSSKSVFFHSMGLCDATHGLTVYMPKNRSKNCPAIKMDDKLEQMLFKAQHAKRRYELYKYLTDLAPKRFRALGPENASAFVSHALKIAEKRDITSYNDIAYIGVVMQCLGSWFDQDMSLAPLSRIMENTERLDPAYKVDRLHKEASRFFEMCHGDNQSILFKRMGEMLRALEDVDLQSLNKRYCYHLLQNTYPERLKYMGNGGFDALWSQSEETARHFDYDQEWHVAILFSFGVLLGVGFYVDPLYPWVAEHLNDTSLTPDDRLLAMSAYGRERAHKIQRLNAANVM